RKRSRRFLPEAPDGRDNRTTTLPPAGKRRPTDWQAPYPDRRSRHDAARRVPTIQACGQLALPMTSGSCSSTLRESWSACQGQLCQAAVRTLDRRVKKIVAPAASNLVSLRLGGGHRHLAAPPTDTT